MPFTATTVNSAAAWRPDLYEFAPADALPEALILQCTTQAGSVEGDAKDTENDTGGQVVAGSESCQPDQGRFTVSRPTPVQGVYALSAPILEKGPTPMR